MPSTDEKTNEGESNVRELRGRVVKAPDSADANVKVAGKVEHICATCKKRFASLASLESHKRMHATKKNEPAGAPKRRAPAAAAASEPKRRKIALRSDSDIDDDDGDEGGEATVSSDRESSPEMMPSPRRLKCKLCSETFADRADWSKHLRTTHAQSALVSGSLPEEAGEGSSRPLRRRVPVKPKEEPEPSFPCTSCTMIFNTKRGLAAHTMHRHKDTPKSPSQIAVEKTVEIPPSTEEEPTAIDVEQSSAPKSAESAKSAATSPPAARQTVQSVSAQIARVAGLEQESEEPDEYEYSAEMIEEEPEPEVENYPCRYCKDRIFLTSFGLERHTKLSHPDNMEEAIKEIKRIQAEKQKKAEARRLVAENDGGGHQVGVFNRRSMAPSAPDPDYVDESHHNYRSRGQQRYSAPAASERRRYSTRGVTLEKENEPNYAAAKADAGEVIQMVRQQRAAIVASASFTEPRATGRHKRSLDAPKAKYQSCEICGILINTEHPKAMESHTKAHQKNQELRQELLRLYGPSWVDNVTCRECNLVFKDEEKLDQHRRNVHVRRRHFLCRFCGDVFRNMRDLNMHKERRHEAYEGHRRNLDGNGNEIMNNGAGGSPQVFRRPAPLGPTGGARNNANLMSNNFDGAAAAADGNVEEFSCRTVCEVCGLQMVRPSNLIRHMKQAHNKTNFTATVETRGMPPFKIDVYDGQFMWGCCDEIYDDRQAFINHRRLAHGPSYVGNPKECEHCGLSFKNNVSYINHLRTHRPRVCHICGESFGNSSADLSSYRVHMLKHRDQGYNIRFSQLDDELSQKENQDLWRAIEEEEADDESEDDYSIFSESGVESDGDENSDLDEEDDGKSLTSCPVCDKRFACVYRFADHWSLHCKRASLVEGLTFKTKPYDYSKGRPPFSCNVCRKRFLQRATLAAHTLRCTPKRFGRVPNEEPDVVMTSPSKSKSVTQTPTKTTTDVVETTTKAIDKMNVDSDASAVLSQELEDSLDVGAEEKQHKSFPMYVEKAYVVEWDTNKLPPEQPYLCRACEQPFGDFLSLIMHIKSHIVHPIYEEDEEERTSTPQHQQQTEKRPVEQALTNGTTDNVSDEGKENSSKETVAKTISEEKPNEEKEESVRACVLRIRTSGASTQGKHACSVCSRRFADKDALEEHVHLNHNVRKQFYCRLCGKKFWTSDGLTNHSKRHDANNFYCSICDKKFVSLETLNKHETVHELTNSLYQCEDCTQSFFGLQQLQRHFKQHHQGVFILTCPICARIHTDAESLRDHFETEHKGSSSKCLLCNKSFDTPMDAKCHAKRIHLLTGPSINCTLCGKIFEDKRQLAMHLWRHTCTNGFQCRICDCSAETDEGVREHLEKVHGINWLDSRDLIIDNQTVFNKDEEGERLMSTDKCFSCYVCDRRFASKILTREHVARVHGRKKKYSCDECCVKFAKTSSLDEHRSSWHNGQNEKTDEAMENENENSEMMAETQEPPPEEMMDGIEEGAEFAENQERDGQTEQYAYGYGVTESMNV